MELVDIMRTVLGTAFVLYYTTHGYHFNVEGPDFYEYHKLLDDQYNEMWLAIDDIAEHLRALDAYAPQSLEKLIEYSRIEGSLPAPIVPKDMISKLMVGNEIMIAVLNEAIDIAKQERQEGLVNFLAGRVEKHQKHRWMLRASSKRV